MGYMICTPPNGNFIWEDEILIHYYYTIYFIIFWGGALFSDKPKLFRSFFFSVGTHQVDATAPLVRHAKGRPKDTAVILIDVGMSENGVYPQ